MKILCQVCTGPGLKYTCEVDDALGVKPGDEVVIQFDKYQDGGLLSRLATVGEGGGEEGGEGEEGEGPAQRPARRGLQGESTPQVIRLMTLADKGRAHENEVRAKSMYRTSQRKVKEHNLPMKMITCHYSLDRTQGVFLFTAEGRVDFRELVRDLSGALHLRIELRQVGVRDEASVHGGIGPCGRAFCCASVLERFHSVNVKMAKVQRLSLNPSSVSGGCGRLKCCLRYEVAGYAEMFRNMPKNGARCDTPQGPGRVMDCNALTQRVRVRLEGDDATVADFAVDEVVVRKGPRPDQRRPEGNRPPQGPPGGPAPGSQAASATQAPDIETVAVAVAAPEPTDEGAGENEADAKDASPETTV